MVPADRIRGMGKQITGWLGLVVGMLALAQRLANYQNRTLALILVVAAGCLFAACLLFVLRDAITRRKNGNRKSAPGSADPKRLLVPVIMGIEATDESGSVTLRVHLLVSNEDETSSTKICGFGARIQSPLATDQRRLAVPLFPNGLMDKTVLFNHPIEGCVDFKIDQSAGSDIKGRSVVVDVLSGQIVDGARKPYSSPPQTIHNVIVRT